MPWVAYFFAAIIGYLFGSIPSGYILARLRGVDITKQGSGRTGGTNVFRALGPKFGLMTGFFDILKGIFAVLIARWLFGDEYAAALAGAFAVLGHNWSIFLGFRGGAGGGTAAGALLALNPIAGLILIPIFFAILAIGRYASIATLSVGLGAVLILTAFWLLHFQTPFGHVLFALLISGAMVWALRPNIMRLISGTERRITLNRP